MAADARIGQLLAAGRFLDAAGILEALGRRDEALAAYRRAGSRADVERLGGRMVEPGSALFRARAHAEQGRSHEALRALMGVRAEAPDYRAACRMAAAVAARSKVLDFDLDHWLGPYLAGRGQLAHERADLPALDALGLLYARQGMNESAVAAYQSILRVDPGWSDVVGRLQLLQGSGPAAPLEDVFEQDLAFHAPRRKARTEGPRKLAPLPDLPDLPSLDSLAALAKGEERPPAAADISHDGAEVDVAATTAEPVAAAFEPLDPDETATQEVAMRPHAALVDRLIAKNAEPDIDPSALKPGDLIADRYTVSSLLGQGGMGMVFSVVDSMLEEPVAMKLVHRQGGAQASDLARFKSEMRICRRLAHPNVVRVFEFGVWRGCHFLTMELLDGIDLEKMIKKAHGPLPLVQSVKLLMQACDGLTAAHEEGVVHRDIKPPNLFVNRADGSLKVMDFGIARPRRVDRELTQTGMVVGSPAYMAPERLQGQDAIPESDIYALGCVAYQMLTGEHPFQAAELAQLFVQHLQQPPAPLRRLNPYLSEPLEQIVLRMLEKDPKKRYSTALEVRRDLKAAWRELLDR